MKRYDSVLNTAGSASDDMSTHVDYCIFSCDRREFT